MWMVNGHTEFFEKGFQIKSFDSNSVLIVGGEPERDSSETLYTKPACNVKVLPFGVNSGHSLLLTAGDHKVLSCGGDYDHYNDICLEMNHQTKQWTFHSRLTHKRTFATAVSMPDGNYIFGGRGYDSKTTSDFLPKSSNIWEAGPTIPGNGITYGCGVKISYTEIVLIGGYDSKNVVIKYNTQTKQWTRMPNLKTGRYDHGCTLFNEKIIVSGGMNIWPNHLSSTEIIPLSTGVPRSGGNLKNARSAFGMLTVGGRFPRVLALGGQRIPDDAEMGSIEAWNDDKAEWTMAGSMKVPRYHFGYLALPESTILCLKN